ncbi:hypothetical protein Cni_G16936 [Canna indica]|uniref:Uncharacterized protein n=1 Tax=Canna indica TaxID=4628 RepID=A0AAQ3KG22_9LILI|nr:hypothetical protein Cni_G16936 [Canna indica]
METDKGKRKAVEEDILQKKGWDTIKQKETLFEMRKGKGKESLQWRADEEQTNKKDNEELNKLADKLSDSFKKISENENAKDDFLEAGFCPEISREKKLKAVKVGKGIMQK